MDSAAFRQLLADAGLRQRQLAALLGVSVSTVNRWCSDERADQVEAPRYAVMFLRAYTLLPPRLRATLLEEETDSSDKS